MDEKRKPGWAFWTVAALLMVVLYVASVGPAWRLVKLRGFADYKAYRAYCWFYAPIHRVALTSEPLEKALNRYCKQWEK